VTEEGESEDDDEVRKILVSASGGSWAERWEPLADALSPWRVKG
jgi:hypothetical protein